MTKDEALKLALEALEAIGWQYVCRSTHHTMSQQHHGYEACPNELTHETAIAALREALAEPKQEPVACVEYIPCCTDQTCSKCKAATPPHRTWIGLTDEERNDLWWTTDIIKLTQAIEAKLKEKNSIKENT